MEYFTVFGPPARPLYGVKISSLFPCLNYLNVRLFFLYTWLVIIIMMLGKKKDGRHQMFHVMIYHESDYQDNRYYHDIIYYKLTVTVLYSN